MQKLTPSPLCTLAGRPAALSLLLGLALCPRDAGAETSCRLVEVRFTPQGFPAGYALGREALSPQIAVWVEDSEGRHVDTLFVTRVTGSLGLGNRSGRAEMKSDFRWPYGRRPMVLPVWAYTRGKQYPLVVMGGRCSPNCGGDAHNGAANPDDEQTVAYHGTVSSAEPYYCSPSGWRTQRINGVDAVSCASAFYSSKGRFLPGATSPYPPRADIDPGQVSPQTDHPDLARFAALNDVSAVSGATPPTGKPLDPPLRWSVPKSLPDGAYVLKVEVNIEGDFNPFWGPGRSLPDKYPTWDNGFGKQYLGQPSIVYAVPFRLEASQRSFQALDYIGYGDITGQSGKLTPPDSTISDKNGSGADRLAVTNGPEGPYRVQVTTLSCGEGTCQAPPPPAALELADKTDSAMTVRLRLQPGTDKDVAVQVRYRESLAITEESFNQALPAPTRPVDSGGVVSTEIVGLLPRTTYHVAARTVAACGATSPPITASTATEVGHFATLSGCFIATAAYGTPMSVELHLLRALRDRYLLPSPLGQALVASYYAASPPLSRAIAGNDWLRAAARHALAPLIETARALPPASDIAQ
jgi:hypothetical protein